MSDDRTQPPSKRRRQLARKQGQAAHSPELTAAAGWLASVALLGVVGGDLALALTKLVHGSLSISTALTADRAAIVAQVRGLILGLTWPLAVILAGFVGRGAGRAPVAGTRIVGDRAACTLRGSPLAYSNAPGLAVRAERSLWSMFKAIVLVGAAAWAIRSGWSDVLKLGDLETPALAHAAGQLALALAWTLAAVLLALGLVDYGLRYHRFESMLRTTTQEQREDRRVIEGDPATRSQRRRVARRRAATHPICSLAPA